VVSDDAARTADGRLFYARGAATENDRSPSKQCKWWLPDMKSYKKTVLTKSIGGYHNSWTTQVNHEK